MNKINVAISVFFISIVSCNSFAGDNYTLSGNVSGYLITTTNCYAAIDDEKNDFYANQWHFGENKGICEFIEMAYNFSIPITAKVVVDKNGIKNTNNIQVVESMYKGCKITWPPYKKNENCKEKKNEPQKLKNR